MKYKNNKGFTLAEVLVTLGIIGVVSAMTIPTLVKNHQRTVYVTQLHKVYNELNQAVEGYTTSRNAINLMEAGVRNQDKVADFVQAEYKTARVCSETATPCFASSYETMDGSDLSTDVFNPSEKEGYCFSTPSGYSMSLAFSGNILLIFTDVNGSQGPNIAGRDFFNLAVSNRRNLVDSFMVVFGLALYDMINKPESEMDKAAVREEYSKNCTSGGLGCFDRILNDNWQMNY